jgi:hypothetical protein
MVNFEGKTAGLRSFEGLIFRTILIILVCCHGPTLMRFNGIEQQCRIGIQVLVQFGLSLGIDDADVHFPCMQIDAAIKFMTLIVKSYGLPPFFVQWVNGRHISSLHCRIKGGNQV